MGVFMILVLAVSPIFYLGIELILQDIPGNNKKEINSENRAH
jgi:hypothetical protein